MANEVRVKRFDFKSGDIVRLKSGGVEMTVGGIDSDYQMAECFWLWKGVGRRAEYPMCVLEHVEPRSELAEAAPLPQTTGAGS